MESPGLSEGAEIGSAIEFIFNLDLSAFLCHYFGLLDGADSLTVYKLSNIARDTETWIFQDRLLDRLRYPSMSELFSDLKSNTQQYNECSTES